MIKQIRRIKKMPKITETRLFSIMLWRASRRDYTCVRKISL